MTANIPYEFRETHKPEDVKGEWNKRFNIIFLDVDGVLNSYSKTNHSFSFDKRESYNIEEFLVRRLNYICEEVPNVRIVISSSWKNNMPKLVKALVYNDFRFPELIVGRTKQPWAINSINDPGCVGEPTPPFYVGGKFRADQILDWLLKNSQYRLRMNNFVIIDDESYDITGNYGFNFLENNFFQTNGKDGISHQTTMKIINFLKEENGTN